MVCDTTAAYSGDHNGAAKILEATLDKKLLWTACRHHVPELLLGAAYEVKFGKPKSKDKKDLKHFKDKIWTKLDKTGQMLTLPGLEIDENIERPLPFLLAAKEESVQVCFLC